MSDTTDLTLRHEPMRRRFVATTRDGEGILEYSEIDARTLDYNHTFVPRELRGGGIASKLVAYALDYAQENGLGVVPSCPFVARYMDQHPEYLELRRP
jgi:predicted GNAT family acetyltransferase